jgi:hypothetical protein
MFRVIQNCRSVRSDLGVDLVRALFCGLPRRELRMAVFVCASDESADQNPLGNFFYAGFAAPLNDWECAFAPAWNERVLNGPPQIPYLHMTEIRSPPRHGLSERQANYRLDEASRVIRSMGSLIPVTFSVDEDEYTCILRQPFNPKPNQVAQLEPDYICFLYFAIVQLHWIYDARPDVEKVDFWVERKKRVTHHLQDFHRSLAKTLEEIDLPQLAPLVGKMQPVGKECIPAQAADMLGWHARNAMRGRLDSDGKRRYWRMTVGDPRMDNGRYGYRDHIDADLMRALADGLQRRRDEVS